MTYPEVVSVMIQKGSPEWNYAWGKIKEREGSYTSQCPESGEVWQYMKTLYDDGGFLHVFRHRQLNGRCVHCFVTASSSDNVLDALDGGGRKGSWDGEGQVCEGR